MAAGKAKSGANFIAAIFANHSASFRSCFQRRVVGRHSLIKQGKNRFGFLLKKRRMSVAPIPSLFCASFS